MDGNVIHTPTSTVVTSRGNPADVGERLNELEKKGDAASMRVLAFAYLEGNLDGESVKRDDSKVMHYAKRAQTEGKTGVLFEIGQKYQKHSLHTSTNLAKECFSIEARQNLNMNAAIELIKMHYDDVYADHGEIGKLTELVKTHGDINTRLALGETHLNNCSMMGEHRVCAKSLLKGISQVPEDYPMMRNLLEQEQEKARQ